ncbi:MAG TPA: hypothetical protein ENO18_04350 [Caldithrix sp.]|nr:hypothetical protein [Caldithrix sp.]
MKKLLNKIYTFVLIVLTVILLSSCSTVQPVFNDVCTYEKEICKYANMICAANDTTAVEQLHEVTEQLKVLAKKTKEVDQ